MVEQCLREFTKVCNARLHNGNALFSISSTDDYCICIENNESGTDVFVPYIHESGKRFEFRYPVPSDCDSSSCEQITKFLESVVMKDLDTYLRHLLPFVHDLSQCLPNSTVCLDIDENADKLRLYMTRFDGDVNSFSEKMFEYPLSTTMSTNLSLKGLFAFCKRKKVSTITKDVSFREMCSKYGKGICMPVESVRSHPRSGPLPRKRPLA